MAKKQITKYIQNQQRSHSKSPEQSKERAKKVSKDVVPKSNEKLAQDKQKATTYLSFGGETTMKSKYDLELEKAPHKAKKKTANPYLEGLRNVSISDEISLCLK